MSQNNLAAVTGAFGYLGNYVTRELLAAGVPIRTLTGHPKRPNPFGNRVEVVPFHFDDPRRLVDDLKGAKLGVASLKGGPTTFLLEYLRHKGLLYPRDFTLVQMAGGTPVRLAALESGAVAAAVLDITNSEIAVDRGLNKLGDVSEVIPKFQFTTINVDPAWAMKNRTMIVKFLKAHIRSLRWISENPGEAADIYAKEMGAKQPYARRGIDYFIRNRLFPPDGAITMEGMKANIEIQAKEGLISGQVPPPEKYVDLSYLKEAQKELGY